MGKHVDYWWTFKVLWPYPKSARIYHLKAGPLWFCVYKFGPTPTRWKFNVQWKGFKPQVTTWMDGDCF